VAGRQPRSSRDARRRAYGQNFLRSEVAEEIVLEADLTSADLVVDIGAGPGVLTEPLARVAAKVIAVEFDTLWAAELRRRFSATRNVEVVEGDALAIAMPTTKFRVVANLPFGRTTAIFGRLLAERSLVRADLVVQWEVAVKRILTPPRNALTIEWAPWWRSSIARRIAATAFRPVPAVDAGLLTLERRSRPLLDEGHEAAFARLVRLGFHRTQLPLARSLQDVRGPAAVRAALEAVRAPTRATAVDLTARQWIGLYGLLRSPEPSR
jgi:23S rRNA (adenine-N6)-dimethyltransferase